MGLMAGIPFRRLSALVAGGCLCWAAVAPVQADESLPGHARDLNYGWMLYSYHQGKAFDALTRLGVARERGGIKGHGDYPELLEGSLMLSYGMTREAGQVFTELLGRDGAGSSLSPEVRNQAWFYLGKVLYLQGDYELALGNLQRVDGDVLEDSDAALYEEWLYLQARLAMTFPGAGDAEAIREQMDEDTLWSDYLVYNHAMQQVADGDREAAVETLVELIEDMEDRGPETEDETREFHALIDKSRLSLARLYVDANRFDMAQKTLWNLPVNGPFSDRALFDYAIAAAGRGDMQRAFNAMETLSRKELFTPWLQQVPYARGYLLEQMNRPREALAAFREAASEYEELDARLVQARAELTEEKLLSGLRFSTDGGDVQTDAYGRLQVVPEDFALSGILATESFQQALSELHELYQIGAFLGDWLKQLDSFRAMLETRRIYRDSRIDQTREVLAGLGTDTWLVEHEQLRQQIGEALEREDAEFFMTTEQKALKRKLDKVAETLAKLPDDERTASQREKFRRMQAYFNWWIVDDYGINRWAAQKQLRELDRVMAVHVSQYEKIEQLMAEDRENQQLGQRLEQKEQELLSLQARLSGVLDIARAQLMASVDEALAKRREQLRGYLVASRHAQARLADQLFRSGAVQGGADE